MTTDLDNVVLFAGAPGNGKSTFALQVARALDPSFTVDRIAFDVPTFVQISRDSPVGSVILADEILANRRKSMSKDNKLLNDHMQVCRALNQHLLMCFPHAAALDKEVLDHRVRYRFDIDPPESLKQTWREAHGSERIVRTYENVKGEEEYAVQWQPVIDVRFHRNQGEFWEEYLAKKMLAARHRDAIARGTTLDEEHSPPKPRRVNTDPKRDGRGVKQRLVVRPTSPLYGILPERSPPE